MQVPHYKGPSQVASHVPLCLHSVAACFRAACAPEVQPWQSPRRQRLAEDPTQRRVCNSLWPRRLFLRCRGPGRFLQEPSGKGASGELDGHPASGSLDLPASPHTALSLSDVKTIRGYCCREGPAVAHAHPRPGPRCIHLWTPDFSSFQEGKSAATQRFLLKTPAVLISIFLLHLLGLPRAYAVGPASVVLQMVRSYVRSMRPPSNLNLKRNLNPKPQTLNPEPQTPNPEP